MADPHQQAEDDMALLQEEPEHGRDELETCVMCDEETLIPIDMPVAHRLFYEPGQGQLCRRCWLDLQDQKA